MKIIYLLILLMNISLYANDLTNHSNNEINLYDSIKFIQNNNITIKDKLELLEIIKNNKAVSMNLLPKIDYQYSNTRITSSDSYQTTSKTLSLRWNLFNAFKDQLEHDKLKASLKLEKLNLRIITNEIIINFIDTYIDILTLKKQLKITKEKYKIFLMIHDINTKKYKNGLISKYTYLLSKNTLSDIETEYELYKNNLQNTNYLLSKYINFTDDTILNPYININIDISNLDINKYIKLIKNNNLYLLKAQEKVNITKIDKKSANYDIYLPKIDYTWYTNETTSNYLRTQETGSQHANIISLEYNLYNGGKDKLNYENKNILYRSAKNNLLNIYDDTIYNINITIQDIKSSKKQYTIIKNKHKTLKNIYSMSKSKFDYDKNIKDYISSVNDYFDNQISLYTYEYNTIKLDLQLLHFLGLLDQNLDINISKN